MSEVLAHPSTANALPTRPLPVKLGLALNLAAAFAFCALYTSRNLLFLFASGAGNLIWTNSAAVFLFVVPLYLLRRIYRAKALSRGIYFVIYALPISLECISKLNGLVIFTTTHGAPIVVLLLMAGNVMLVVPSSNRWFHLARQSVRQSPLFPPNTKRKRPFIVTITIILNFLALVVLFPFTFSALLSLVALGTIILTTQSLPPNIFSTLNAQELYRIFLAFFVFLFPYFLLIKISFGKNWARWTYTVLACLYVFWSFYRWTVAPPSLQALPIFALIAFFFPLACIFMLFLPASNRWFKAHAA